MIHIAAVRPFGASMRFLKIAAYPTVFWAGYTVRSVTLLLCAPEIAAVLYSLCRGVAKKTADFERSL